MAGTFQLNNFTVYTATSAKECLAIYGGLKDSIDMVLMDGAIAGDQGVEVIINIRSLKPDQKIMVVVEEENVKSMVMRVGADVVVMKPISPDLVLRQVNDMLLQTKSFLDRKQAKFQRQAKLECSNLHNDGCQIFRCFLVCARPYHAGFDLVFFF